MGQMLGQTLGPTDTSEFALEKSMGPLVQRILEEPANNDIVVPRERCLFNALALSVNHIAACNAGTGRHHCWHF